MERDFTAGKFGHLARVDVHAKDFVTQFGHHNRMRGTEVSGSNDGASHAVVIALSIVAKGRG